MPKGKHQTLLMDHLPCLSFSSPVLFRPLCLIGVPDMGTADKMFFFFWGGGGGVSWKNAVRIEQGTGLKTKEEKNGYTKRIM